MTESIGWKLRQTWNHTFFIPKSKFNVEDIPDLSGKVIIVTGGNTGIGKETVNALLNRNAKVYMASRSREKAESAIADLATESGKRAIFLELDLADFASVKKAAQVFQSMENDLHVLFNNGGVLMPNIKDLTKQGYDLQFGTNVLGHYYFTVLLLPTLLETAKRSDPGTVRVITTSSSMSYIYNKSDVVYATMRDFEARKKMGLGMLYAQSKFGNTLFAKELARRYATEGITSISLHPGSIQSDLQRTTPKLLNWFLRAVLLHPTSYGAITQLYAGTAPEAKDHNGQFLVPWARVGQHTRASSDPEVALRLWNWFEGEVKAWEESRSSE